MTEILPSKPPTWYWVVVAIAFVWNLMGVAAYLQQMSIDEATFAAMAANQRALYEHIPPWVTAAFAIAVFGGSLGCLLLLMRKSFAVQGLIVSFIAVTVQMIYNVFISDAIDVYGSGSLGMPAMIFSFSVGLVFLARYAKKSGWLL